MGQESGLPVPSTGGDSMALRDVYRRGAEVEKGNGGGDGDRSGLQRVPVQFGSRRDDIAFTLLLSFARHLVQNTVSHDALWLALDSAQRDMGATEDQMVLLRLAVKRERAAGPWPEGF